MHLLASGQKRLFPSPQALLIMRLTAFLLTAAVLQVSARGSAQITLAEMNAPLAQVLQSVKQQSGYDLFYDEDLVKQKGKPVDIDVRNVTVEQALDLIFRSQPLTYTLAGRIISVKERETPVPLPAAVPPPNDIHGRVTDSLGNPLAGASVTVKGSKRGTATNEKGEFDLKGIGDAETLVISFSGFETRKITVHGKDGWQIVLSRSNSQLDQVQVIAYGTTTERLNTGNVTTVTSKDIEQQPVSNPLLALEGRVPGLLITQSNGLPGGGITTRIQGQNSLAMGNDPLYVIDGVPYISQMLSTVNGGPLGQSGGAAIGYIPPGGGNPLSYINPSDIESISVLKDADATAIYGSQAANGAILITTKKGKAGPTKVDVKVQDGLGQETRRLHLLNTQQYLGMRHEALNNDGITPSLANGDYDLLLWDTTRYTDWQKVLLGGTARYTNVNAGVSGGTMNTQFLIDGTYHRETTVFPGDFADQKGAVHFNVNNSSSNNKFHVQFSGNYMIDDNKLPQLDFTQDAIELAPDAPALYNSSGGLNWEPTSSGTTTFYNPLGGLYNTYSNKTNNLISNANIGYVIARGLDIGSSFGYTNLQTNEIIAFPLMAIAPDQQAYRTRSAVYSSNNVNSWIVEPQAHWKKAFGKGKLDVLVGSTFLQRNSNGQQLYGSGYNSDQVLQDILAAGSVIVNSTVIAQYNYNAVFGRVNYNWSDKYIVDLTARRDGSSRFGPSSQFHDFESAGLAWIFTQEDFFKQNFAFLSFGKLKGSFGTTGSDQIGDYQFLNLYYPTSAGIAYQNSTGLAPGGLTNPYLAWEETRKLEAGLDLGFVKDRVLFSATYIHNRSSNELLPYALPLITGFGGINENFPATLQNNEWELSLMSKTIKTANFSWTSSLNLTIPKNKLVSFPDLASSSYADSYIIGQPVNIVRAFHLLGVDPATGVYKFQSKTDPFNPVYPDDATKLINTNPTFYGGFQNTFTFKGFQLDFLFQFVKQTGLNFLYYFNAPIAGQFNGGLGNEPMQVLDRWQKPGDVAAFQKYTTTYNWFQQSADASSSDAAYSEASYVRLKNLAFSWQLPEKLRKGAHMQTCKIYLAAQNLLTFTDHYKGLDPETQSELSVPPLRVVTLGIQVGL
jgi:TonB-linked SusC/RagA family outer membrane protein